MDIYRKNRQCDHYKKPGYFKCDFNEYCAYRFLLPSDFNMVEASFNLFFVIVQLKKFFPEHLMLKEFSLEIATMVPLHQKYSKIYGSVIEKEAKAGKTDHLKPILLNEYEQKEKAQIWLGEQMPDMNEIEFKRSNTQLMKERGPVGVIDGRGEFAKEEDELLMPGDAEQNTKLNQDDLSNNGAEPPSMDKKGKNRIEEPKRTDWRTKKRIQIKKRFC